MHASTAYTSRTLRQLDEEHRNNFKIKLSTDVVTRFLSNPAYVIKVRLQSRDCPANATFFGEFNQLHKEGGIVRGGFFRGGCAAAFRYSLFSGLQVVVSIIKKFENTHSLGFRRYSRKALLVSLGTVS